MAGEIYNPLDKRSLGQSVANALLRRPTEALQGVAAFNGAGIYALYYVGGFTPYRPISLANSTGQFKQPIYVGKAVPAGARKGGFGLGANPGRVLFRRLNEHAESIRTAKNLSLDDFHCRYLVTDDIWIPLAEAMLIDIFNPIWNKLLDGFGNHDPGKGRYPQQRAPWDTLHPGRSWAEKVRPGKNQKQLLSLLSDFFRGRPVPTIATEDAVTEEES
jgi:hypothetical protein